jgi:hypothetical protein
MKSLVVFLAFIQSLAFAGRGNEGSGGGNTLPNTPATQQDIEFFLKDVRQYTHSGFIQLMMIPELQYMVGYQDEFKIDNKTVQLTEELSRKLNSQNLLNLVQSFKIKIAQNQPCYDSLNYNPPQPRDASANVQTQTICISPSEILKRSIPLNQLYHKLTALFVHEVSHLIGYQETQAEIFQAALEKMMRGYSKEEMEKYKRRVFFYVDYDTPDLVEVLHDDLNQNKPFGQICFRLGQLEQIVMGDQSDIEGSLFRFGFSIFNLETFKLAKLIREPVDVMESICKQQLSNISKQQIQSELNKLSQLYRQLTCEIEQAPFLITK